MTQPRDNRYAPGARREYRNDRIVVHWEPEACIHVGRCLRLLPEVFDVNARPWLNIDGADPDRIAEVVRACPSGALTYERLDGGEQEPVPETTSIEAQPNGPYHVRGPLDIVAADGQHVTRTRAALCRCGYSENKPFCDMMHRLMKFRG